MPSSTVGRDGPGHATTPAGLPRAEALIQRLTPQLERLTLDLDHADAEHQMAEAAGARRIAAALAAHDAAVRAEAEAASERAVARSALQRRVANLRRDLASLARGVVPPHLLPTGKVGIPTPTPAVRAKNDGPRSA